MTEIGAGELERFRAAIGHGLGLRFDDGKRDFLSEVLQRRLESSRQNADVYLSRLEQAPARDELEALGQELTIPETYFFRNTEQLHAVREVVLPELCVRRAAERRLRILSLGCASGEEAYSLAMVARDVVPGNWNVSVTGVDVNSRMIEKAKRGRYSAWALRQTDEHDRQRWFRPQGRDFIVADPIRALVSFDQRNLVNADPGFWRRSTCDVVFCRNVIMYFDHEQAAALVARTANLLCDDGYLFLGHAETLRGLSDEFHLRQTHGAFYYKRIERTAGTRAVRGPSGGLARPNLTPDLPPGTDWVDAIQRASQRVTALTDVTQAGGPHPASRAAPAWDRGAVMELLRQERFVRGLALVDEFAASSPRDPELLLLRAALLVHVGRLADGERACRRLLEIDELSAGAHYLRGLCREAAGDQERASYHHRIAVYLDPGFAMPRLHLGLAYRRAGDLGAARQELGHALVLLQREDAGRILLFGGGFGRDALIALCRTELSRCGERRAR